MKIKRIDIYRLDIELTHPTRVPLGILSAAHNVVVKITSDSGLSGWGEASPFAPITGDSQDSSLAAAQLFGQLIKGNNPLAVEACMREINAATIGEPSTRAAFDIALHDLAAKHCGLPLYQYLGGEKRRLRTDITIGMQDTVEQTLEHFDRHLEAGFEAIKLKVGRAGLADVDHVAAVRQRGGKAIQLKIDSNQGWDLPTAIANLDAMAPLGLQYSEQPLAAWDYDNMKRLRERVSIPICADESVFDDHDAFKLTSMGAVDFLNIKLGKSGGISTGLRIEAIARSANCKCMIGCFAESRLALSAAAHLATARPNIHFLDLDSAYIFSSDPVQGGIRYDDDIGGLIHLPDAPGHGAEFDEQQLQHVATVE
jgi:L-alanine-DL-glutamate epimerase-like enolase superfamily enzyme